MVTRPQLLALGIGARTIKRWVASGRLIPVHRGVYAVGHQAPVPFAREMAATLACGEGALLSHRSAAGVWGLLHAAPGDVDVTVRGRSGRSRPGIRIHRPTADVEGTRREGIPITTPARTIVDLAAVESERVLERALNEALVQRVTTTREIDSLTRRSSCHGKSKLTRVLEATTNPQRTRSEAEQRTRELIERAGLPRPQTNQRLHGFEVDFLWREQRFVLEVDGYRFHSTRHAFERDRTKDAALATHGFTVARISWRQITERPEVVVARIASGLAG